MTLHIGIDIGGTFTDVTLLRDDGTTAVFKTPSTPEAPERGVIHGVELALARAGATGAECAELIVSATVGLNAVIERKGSAVGLLVTAGFEDILELGRVKMTNVFSLKEVRRPPLIRKNWVRGVDERLSAGGQVLRPLDREGLLVAARDLVAQGAKTIAILFLHAYRNALHERQAAEILQAALPQIDVAISSALWPQIREYERATVLAMNSYITPKIRGYIAEIDRRKAELGLTCPLHVSASNGGLVPAPLAAGRPITTLLSGPSAGVVAAVELMRGAGIDAAITFDMGGTSADICVLQQRDIPYAWGQEIEGLPIVMPYVDVSAIGSGGGSIAHVDNVGLLRVGPESAGSVPGPAAYGRGGTRPTVTDAYLVNGYIDAGNVIGGEIELSLDRATAAIGRLADALGLGVPETAAGILKVTTSIQVAEFTRLAAKKGVDFRDFVLIPFGGAGPTQACLLADEMQIRRIAIPATPGVFCALGSVLADFRLDYIRTVYGAFDTLDEAEIDAWFAAQAAAGRVALADVAERIAAIEMRRVADVRYQGQGFEVAVEFTEVGDVPEAFRREYEKLYGSRDDTAQVEIIAFRASVIGRRLRPTPRPALEGVAVQPPGERRIALGTAAQVVPVYRRDQLAPGWRGEGPFLVDQSDTTCLVTPGWQATVDGAGTLHLRKDF